MTLTLVAALTWPGRVIGRDGAIPWRLPEDLRRFKSLTLGHPVVMGRRTWDSLPFKLPGRTNIVLSRDPGRGAWTGPLPDILAPGLEEALAAAQGAPGGAEVFVIGGAQVYAQALPRADRLALTLIHHPFDGDTLFPAWDPGRWRETSRRAGLGTGEAPFEYAFVDLETNRP